MFRIETVDDLGEVIRHVDDLSRPDLTPLAETLRGIMIADNRDGLLAGTDANDAAMTPLEQSTIDRGRGGDGEPLVQRSEGSRAISDYRADVEAEATSWSWSATGRTRRSSTSMRWAPRTWSPATPWASGRPDGTGSAWRLTTSSGR
jgi:hypothetical protein